MIPCILHLPQFICQNAVMLDSYMKKSVGHHCQLRIPVFSFIRPCFPIQVAEIVEFKVHRCCHTCTGTQKFSKFSKYTQKFSKYNTSQQMSPLCPPIFTLIVGAAPPTSHLNLTEYFQRVRMCLAQSPVVKIVRDITIFWPRMLPIWILLPATSFYLLLLTNIFNIFNITYLFCWCKQLFSLF